MMENTLRIQKGWLLLIFILDSKKARSCDYKYWELRSLNSGETQFYYGYVDVYGFLNRKLHRRRWSKCIQTGYTIPGYNSSWISEESGYWFDETYY